MTTVDKVRLGQLLALTFATLGAISACGGTSLKGAQWERHDFELDDMAISMLLPHAPPGKHDYYYLGSRTAHPMLPIRKLHGNEGGMELAGRSFDWMNAQALTVEVWLISDRLTPGELRSGESQHALEWLRRGLEKDVARCAANPKARCNKVVKAPHLVNFGETEWALLIEQNGGYEVRWYMRALSKDLVLRTSIEVKYDWLARRGNAQVLEQATRRHLESITVISKLPLAH